MGNRIYLFIGKSGSGKTTIAETLGEKYGWKIVESYTTRLPRFEGESGHKFVSEEEFDKLLDICAYTLFDGHKYGATQQQIDEADIYIVDPKGLTYFMEHYQGGKDLVAVYFRCNDSILRQRLLDRRGATIESVQQRIANDEVEFQNVIQQLYSYDELSVFNIYTDGKSTPENIAKFIEAYERELKYEEENCCY